MQNIDECSIERLIIKVARKKLTCDDVLKSHYTEEDYIHAGEWFTYCSLWNTSLIHGYEEKRDCMAICQLLAEAAKNKGIARGLERTYSSDNEMDLNMSWDEPLEEEIPSCKDVHDAFVLSLVNKARVDIAYIAEASGLNKSEVISQLKGLIYLNPETWNGNIFEGWETSDQYLSGNMHEKLKIAKEANSKYDGLFEDNIRAIKKVRPKAPESDEIYITLGSPWVPTTVIDDFIEYLLGKPNNPEGKTLYLTKHDHISGTWEVTNGNRYTTYNVAYTRVWGTAKCPALRIIENSLNMKKPIIYDYNKGIKADGSYGEIKTINKEETALAQEKQRAVIEEFQNWVWTDSKRKEELMEIYNNRYSSFIRRKYDGSYLTFPGMNPDIELFDYQKDAVARILYSKNVLLAHDVGSGKTYEMIAAGMELRRIGLGKKILYVVPNNIVSQWERDFHLLYPNSKTLLVEPGNFSGKKRQKVLERIMNEDFDGIIMAYSCFDLISLSRDIRLANLNEERIKVAKSMATVEGNTNVMKKRSEALFKKVMDEKLSDKEEGITFDMLGIDHLFLDEAHNYKNVPVTTKMSMVLGVNANGSRKCAEMLEKVQYIQKRNNGGGVVLATGTPITNSITEAYILQLYLQKGMLELLDLESFDAWAGMFGETKSEFEIDVTTNSYRFATRFSRFHNLPELTNLLSMVADFHRMDEIDGLPEFDGYNDITIKKSVEMSNYLDHISERADKVRQGAVPLSEDNLLKITTDARKAALDLRLIDQNLYGFRADSKVGQCAKNIYMEYLNGDEEKVTQLVFCDSSTPKDSFNMYDELSSILTHMGIPSNEIAYVHDASSEKERITLYEKMRKGEIRVLIGSTFKLGIGVNVQDRVKALHHLDIPWRPADMTQREGRILRQGNLNESVHIYRYVTEGSFDAYSWQLLETKQKFITDILSGAMDERDGDEIDETVLSYAEIKALAIGKPEMKERAELINEVSRLGIIRNKNIALKLEAEKELMEIPVQMEIQKGLIEKAKEDKAYIDTLELDKEVELSKSEKEELAERRKAIRLKLDEAITNNVLLPEERELMEYHGFSIVLPKMMAKDKPYVLAIRSGRYPIEMGDSETGNLIRLDNFFTGFDKVLKEKEEALKRNRERKSGLLEELERKDDVQEQIEQLNKKITVINERMGLIA